LGSIIKFRFFNGHYATSLLNKEHCVNKNGKGD